MALYFSRENVPYEVGYDTFPQRKRPQLAIRNGNVIKSYGSFRDEDSANEYFAKLAELIGAELISESGEVVE